MKICGSNKVQCGLFICSWLTCVIAMACFWPRSGKPERSDESTIIPHAPDVGRIWADNMLLSGITHFLDVQGILVAEHTFLIS